jgi:hypothetical protein
VIEVAGCASPVFLFHALPYCNDSAQPVVHKLYRHEASTGLPYELVFVED